jgi:hypothetical protein
MTRAHKSLEVRVYERVKSRGYAHLNVLGTVDVYSPSRARCPAVLNREHCRSVVRCAEFRAVSS